MTYLMWHKMQHQAALNSNWYETGPWHIWGVIRDRRFYAAIDKHEKHFPLYPTDN